MNQDPFSRMLARPNRDDEPATAEALASELNTTISILKQIMAVRITNEEDLRESNRSIEDRIWRGIFANMYGAEQEPEPSRALLIEQLNEAARAGVIHMFGLIDGLARRGASLDVAVSPVVGGEHCDANYLVAHPMTTRPDRLEEAANATAQALFVLTGRPDLPYGMSIHQETDHHVTYHIDGIPAERVRPNFITGVYFSNRASGLAALNMNFVHSDPTYDSGLSGNAPSPNVPLDWIESVQLHTPHLSE